MRQIKDFYIDGAWVPATGSSLFEVFNPATEQQTGVVSLASDTDVDAAIAAARAAFPSYSLTSREERLAILERIAEGLEARRSDLAAAVTLEIGTPKSFAEAAHAGVAAILAEATIETLKSFEFESERGTALVRQEPIGICGLITPWNWPIFVVLAKALPAIASGCTVVLKPSEYTPYSARILAEVFHDAELPKGVFNMIFGDGPGAGARLSVHPDVDMISITGSTRAGIEVARNAAGTVKRVHQELGGKSPNIFLEDADFEAGVAAGVQAVMSNAGQTCSAPTRMIVPSAKLDEVAEIASATVATMQPGGLDSDAILGPVANKAQWERVQSFIEAGIAEGARLVAGGPGRADGFDVGYYVQPTIFAEVYPDMRIVREEIFGPVLVIQTYDDEAEAVALANHTKYGLNGFVQGGDIERLRRFGRQISAGQVYLNCNLESAEIGLPFGGYKMSGNGREGGASGLEAFLETKAYLGFAPALA